MYVIFFAGANIGMFALYAAHHTQRMLPDSVTIIAIEPMRANFTLLQHNLHLHNVHGRCYRCAVGIPLNGPVGERDIAAALTRLSGDNATENGEQDLEVTREVPVHSKVCEKRLLLCHFFVSNVNVLMFFLYFLCLIDNAVLPAHAWQLLQLGAHGFQYGITRDKHEPQRTASRAEGLRRGKVCCIHIVGYSTPFYALCGRRTRC